MAGARHERRAPARFGRMKTVWVIVCSLLLAGNPILPAQAQPTRTECAATKRCCCGDDSSCCAAKNSPESRPDSAVPVAFNFQTEFQILAPSQAAFALIAAPAPTGATAFPPPTPIHPEPIFELGCARLI
jgi:hypothetical protein